MKTKVTSAALLAVWVGATCSAQVLITSPRTVEAPSSDYKVSYQRTAQNPPSYDLWYNANRNPYVLSPYMIVLQQPKRAPVPAMPKYSEVEYGKIMEQVLTASAVQPAGARSSVASVVDKAAANVKQGEPNKTIEAHVVDVLDRGLLVLDTYDEVKLRGVTMASENEIDEVTRYYARLGIDTLRRLLTTGPIYLQLGKPERSADGPVLADIFLPDGSLVNRQILELGYGHFDNKDFLPDQISVTLQAAEQRARNAKVGLFSKEKR
ncbi:MAG: thermonuclease family protein [Candidatus Sumerlaeaceae bacterium]